MPSMLDFFYPHEAEVVSLLVKSFRKAACEYRSQAA
jgi:hypothetical protein